MQNMMISILALYLSPADLVYEFVRWIQEQDFYDNTTIVISSDHLTMDVDFFDDLDTSYERTVYNLFINPVVTTE